MAEIRWTLQALADVEAIADYIAKDSAYYAQVVVSKLFEAVCRIELIPGVRQNRSGNQSRRYPGNNARQHRIIYRLKAMYTEIITVYHGSRLLNEDDMTSRSAR